MRRVTTIALLLALGCFAIAGWLAFHSRDETAEATTNDPDVEYSNLHVSRGDIGWFEGSITVENTEAADRRAFVTVNLYDDDQNVGELSGDAVLKPRSRSSIELISTDDFVDYDEARVELWFGGAS